MIVVVMLLLNMIFTCDSAAVGLPAVKIIIPAHDHPPLPCPNKCPKFDIALIGGIITKVKNCKDCKLDLPLSNYYLRHPGYYSSYCKSCCSLRAKDSYDKKTYGSTGFVYKTHCEICSTKLTETTKCRDHDHKSGVTRGTLCKRCNSGIGYFFDDTELMLKAVEYLNLHKA